MSQGDHIELTGVIDTASKGIFGVRVVPPGGGPEKVITCKPSGKIRIYKINLCVGDKVAIKVSPYDMEMGFIQRRL